MDSSFKDYIVEQLRNIPQVEARSMFGGYGLYSDGVFFGIISDDTVYFKTDENSRADYLKMNSKYFQPNEKQALKNYYEVPGEVVEDLERFTSWAEKAIGIGKSR